LKATFGGNLPVTDSDFMIAKVVVLGAADIVSCPYASSQRTCMFKQSGPLFIDSYSVALLVVDIAILFPMRPQAKHILLTLLACLLVATNLPGCGRRVDGQTL